MLTLGFVRVPTSTRSGACEISSQAEADIDRPFVELYQEYVTAMLVLLEAPAVSACQAIYLSFNQSNYPSIHLLIYVSMGKSNTYVHMHVYLRICKYAYTHMHIYIYMYTYTHIRVHTHSHIHVHIHVHTHRHMDT